MYRVLISKAALKDLDRLSDDIRDRINARLAELATNPRPADVKKLKGRDAWRIRIGDYRAIFSIIDRDLIVFVVRVRHRREVYR
jgi:mRNA interferase RelE/StbE